MLLAVSRPGVALSTGPSSPASSSASRPAMVSWWWWLVLVLAVRSSLTGRSVPRPSGSSKAVDALGRRPRAPCQPHGTGIASESITATTEDGAHFASIRERNAWSNDGTHHHAPSPARRETSATGAKPRQHLVEAQAGRHCPRLPARLYSSPPQQVASPSTILVRRRARVPNHCSTPEVS